MIDYNISELEKWDEKIKILVKEFGLDPYPQTFELCDYEEMIGYMAYSGMPSRYPHWSFGKQFEKQKTLYNYGIAGLPYEMVINSNPCLGYLMSDNSLLLQILTMAHVYAHNDFFKNNLNFQHTHAEYTLESFKNHADRIRKYCENPQIGIDKVEKVLDAAHALSLNCNRYPNIKSSTEKYTRKEKKKKCGKCDDKKCESEKKNVDNINDNKANHFSPDENLLLVIRDNNPKLNEWEKDLLTIVHEESQYFIPQIQTKIMNEGWAVLWHKRILDNLELPQDLQMEFLVRHNQVVRPIPRSLNPYHIGSKVFEDIYRRWENPSEKDKVELGLKGGEGQSKIYQVRETDRDESFLRQFLTRELMEEMDLYQHEEVGKDRVVTKVASEQDWKDVRQMILLNVGLNSVPIIKVTDVDYENAGKLLLAHEFENRELDMEYAKPTLEHVFNIWRRPIALKTTIKDKEVLIICEDIGKIEVKGFKQ
ncbi:SpoVR family protein [bacterium]|nr:SpoVR family protein [bacterium]